MTRPAVSQHLSVLREAGLLSERRDGARRLYRARPEGLQELRAFLEDFWGSRSDAGIGGGIGGFPDGPGHVTFYVQVPDLQAALDRVEELGGRTVMPPDQAGPAEIAQFADPQGQVVGLVKGEES